MASMLKRLLELIVKHNAKISILGYVVGIIWFLALVHPSVNNKTYLSENALLPGMVYTQYEYGREAKSLLAQVENPSETYRDNFSWWLMNKMTSIGLESYQQNFTIQFPKEFSGIANKQISGTNVYGILRSPRMARTEALVFMVPLKPASDGPFYELVLLLSLMELFRSNIYWSKDIIFLVVEQKEAGIQSWLDEYHGIQSKYIKSSRMLGRSGAIQAAINLQLDDKDISSIEVLLESLNGLLPNLDLINMVMRLCQSEQIPVDLRRLPVRFLNDGLDEYRSLLSTMISMMFTQASGRASANHGLFPKYGIEAVTLRGRKNVGASSVSFARLGRALEGMFRSLNSLLESFHQSFFFYLLPSKNRYVSIGLYMPPLGCIMIGPILTAVACWLSSVTEKAFSTQDIWIFKTKSGVNLTENEQKVKAENNDDKNYEEQTEGETKENDAAVRSKDKDGKSEEFAFNRVPRHFGKVLRVILASYFVGLLVYFSPYIANINFGESSELLVVLLFGAFALGLSLPFWLRLTGSLFERDVVLLKSISLVIYTCQVGCLTTINFSFGFFLVIFTAPSFLYVRSTQSRIRRMFQVFFVFLSSPPCVLFLMHLLYSFFSSTSDSYHEILQKAKTSYIDGILISLTDSVLLGTWSYPVTILFILPNWILFWCIAWM